MGHPLTDIIVLVHNNKNLTEKFVEHLFANTSNFRLIFVDNGSQDDVKDFLEEGKKNNKWELIRSETNLGIINGRNLGAKFVTADYFVNLDNDQYPKYRWLDNLHELMGKGYDIVGAEAWRLLPPKKQGVVIVDHKSYDRSYFPYKKCNKPTESFSYVGCGGMLIKYEVYKNIGLFDERYNPAYFEDPDFCFNALKNNYKIAWCSNCEIEHLAHQTINGQKLFYKNTQFSTSWKKFKEKWNPYFPEYLTNNL